MAWFWNAILAKLLPRRELQPLAALFPAVAAADVQAVLAIIPLATTRQIATSPTLRVPHLLLSADARLINWQGLRLLVPYRVYFPEPALEQVFALTSRQRQVLHCLYLRHHNGYVRQRHLEALFALSGGAPEAFITSFTFSLLGEYVRKIMEVLAQHLRPTLLTSYVQLIRENPLYWRQTQGRVASYWDVYYRVRKRGAPRFKHYVGARLLAILHQAYQPATRS